MDDKEREKSVTKALIEDKVLDPVLMGKPQDKFSKQSLGFIPGGYVRSPVSQYLSDLSKSTDPKLKTAYTKHTASMKQHCQGQRLPHAKYHHWDNGLGDYKHNGSKTRIIITIDGPRIILLSGILGKKENALSDGDVTRALALRDEYLERKRRIVEKLGLKKEKSKKKSSKQRRKQR